MSYVVVVVLAYLVGAIPFAVFVAYLVGGVDLRRIGSGNTGAMNTILSVGKAPGVFAGTLDVAKGMLMMLLARVLVGKEAATVAGGAAIVGHCYSVWLLWAARHERGGGWKMWMRRMGGKGLATGLGVLLVINWPAFVTTVALFFAVFLIQMRLPLPEERRTDVTYPTVVALAFVPLILWYWTHSPLLILAGTVLALATGIKHLPDMRESFYVAEPPQKGE